MRFELRDPPVWMWEIGDIVEYSIPPEDRDPGSNVLRDEFELVRMRPATPEEAGEDDYTKYHKVFGPARKDGYVPSWYVGGEDNYMFVLKTNNMPVRRQIKIMLHTGGLI